MSKNYKLTGIEPAAVWKYFYEISQIPRESGNNEGITKYLLAFCEEHNIEAVRDDAYNVIARVKAAPGYEGASTVLLQSHSDMVCIKDPGSTHDFSKDPIPLYAEGDIITAEGTTLGADDGIGVAFMLALMASDKPHPALECVFTADEETDMNGGVNLDYSQLKAKYFINLDGFGFAVGSAGEIDIRMFVPFIEREIKEESTSCCITVSGLLGGHSGNQAMDERANAIVLLNRVLLEIEKICSFQILDIKGGRAGGCMATAIAANAEAVIALPTRKLTEVQEKVEMVTAMLKKEYDKRDPDITITILQQERACNAMDDEAAKKVIDLLTLLPDGLHSTNQHWENTMGSTSNVGVLEKREDVVEVAVTIRSTDTKRYYLLEQVCRICDVLGLRTELICDFPAWEYNVDEEWMDMIKKLYPEYKPRILPGTGELGFFTKGIPGLKMVSLTPSAYNCHSTNESLCISECQYFWDRLLKLLEQMKNM